MNQLKTDYNGGWALELNDIDFLNAAIREAFYGLLSAFGINPVDSFIISGCAPAGLNYNAGFVSLNGEILKVDGGVLPVLVGAEVLFWDVDVTYPTSGREQLEIGINADTYEVRKGIVVKGTPAAGTYMPFQADTLARKIARISVAELPNVIETPREVGDATYGLGTSYFGSPAWRYHFTHPLTFWKDLFGYVHIDGWVGVGQGTSIFQLPVGYRPARYGLHPIVKKVNTVGTIANRLFIDTTGLVFVNGTDTYDPAEELSLDGIVFKAA